MLKLDDCFSIVEEDTGTSELETLVLEAVKEAVTALKEMRDAEGAALAQDVSGHLQNLRIRLEKVKRFCPCRC